MPRLPACLPSDRLPLARPNSRRYAITALGLPRLTRSQAQLAAQPALRPTTLEAATPERVPAPGCRSVPERKDDFAWENDQVAFGAYGPALREGTEDRGIDCWLKRVPYP